MIWLWISHSFMNKHVKGHMVNKNEVAKGKIKMKSCIFLFFFASVSMFAASPPREFISIQNNSGQIIIVTVQYHDGPLEVLDDITWIQYLQSLRLQVEGLMLLSSYGHFGGRVRIGPNQSVTIVSYSPFGSWDMLAQISFMDKMQGIFQSLNIITKDGSNVITLENLSDQSIERVISLSGRGGATYIIRIFD